MAVRVIPYLTFSYGHQVLVEGQRYLMPITAGYTACSVKGV